MPLLYGLASLLTWLAFHVFHYRRKVIEPSLRTAFPDWNDAQLDATIHRYYAGYADVLVEIVKSASMSAEALRGRVRFINIELAREHLGRQRPLLLLAGHQCNWEWMLLALSCELGFPVDAAYKPLVNPWAENEMHALRCRFGARMVPAQSLLADLIQHRRRVRAIAMVADQEPVNSEQKLWLKFLNRDSAFFLGAEEISRTMRYAALFMQMRRTSRGHYEIEFQPLADPATESLTPGEFTARYARCVEAQIHASPADWPWSHKRWRLRKPLYG